MDAALVEQVQQRAKGCCEYCRMPQSVDDVPFEVDHIRARKHGGLTRLQNLALSCFFYNSYKGPNIAGIDPNSGRLAPLFNPRRHKWHRHFRWAGAILTGTTPQARATIAVLNVNDPFRVALRASLMAEGLFPPDL